MLRQKAFDMWLACHAQEEIAAEIRYAQRTVADFLKASGFSGNAQEHVSAKSIDSSEEDAGEDAKESSGLGSITLSKEQIATGNHDVAFKLRSITCGSGRRKPPGRRRWTSGCHATQNRRSRT
jgi:hypothetical protein